MILTIEAPTRWLNANDREHRIGDNVNVQAWKKAARAEASDVTLYRTIWPVEIVGTVHKDNRRKYDAHNLYPTLKACIDGLVKAGIIPDDSNEYVTFVGIRAGEIRKPAQLVLEVNPA